MQVQEVFDNLSTQEFKGLVGMPAKLAEFIDSLVTFAQSQGVNKSQLFENLCNRQWVIEMSKSSFGFDSTTQKPIDDFVTFQPKKQINPNFIDSKTEVLNSVEPLKAMIQFINNPQPNSSFARYVSKQYRLPNIHPWLDFSDENRAKRIDRVGFFINNSIQVDSCIPTNYQAELYIFSKTADQFSEDGSVHQLPRKLINMPSVTYYNGHFNRPSKTINHGLSQKELEGLLNSRDCSRGKFINWLVKIVADAARGNVGEANSVGIKNHADFLTVIKNIQLLGKL